MRKGVGLTAEQAVYYVAHYHSQAQHRINGDSLCKQEAQLLL